MKTEDLVYGCKPVKASFCSVPFFLSFLPGESVSQSVSQYVVAVGVGVGCCGVCVGAARVPVTWVC